jgi:benzoyl-CoA reductase/2-hydroxyglutaryl-CoA dehydratase subunit BcrC/BadD/HgdB
MSSPPVLGYLCRAFPPAVAVGLGLDPMRGVVHGFGRAGEALVRPDLCPLVKSVLGGSVSREGVFGTVDAWAGMYTCDMTRRLFQEMQRVTGIPVFQFQLPATRSRESALWFAGSVAELCDEAVKAGISRGYDQEAALEWELERIEAAGEIRSAAISWGVPPLELHRMLMDFFIRNRFPKSIPSGSAVPSVKVAVTGSATGEGDETVPGILQKLGAGYLPLGCTGLAGLPVTVPADGSPKSLALASFQDTRCIRNRPNSGVFTWTGEQMSSSGCSGLVLKTLSFCDLWHTEKERIRSLPVPVLVLSSDLSPGEAGRAAVRLQAFVETLEACDA